MARLWDKGEAIDRLVLEFCTGRDHELDRRLVPYDVRASIAHVRMLAARGHLEPRDGEVLVDELDRLGREFETGAWTIGVEEEDAHTALEARLIERLGEIGGRVHLGRSRNDQVLAALRLYLKDALTDLSAATAKVEAALQSIESGPQGSLVMPGYTHQQRAMPQTVALWAAGFRAEFACDREGLAAARRRVDKNPLGSAAGYGVPILDLDRGRTTEELGFAVIHEPVTAVQISRGKAEAGVLFECTLLLQDVGRLAADLCLFATAEFGFVRLASAFTTGSSIMPQKRNPDVFELLRGRSAQAAADLQAVLSVTAKMTSGYHRDLQLTKEPLFRGLDRAAESLVVLAHALAGLTFDQEALERAVDPSLFATERAIRLVVETGLPFREAYRRVAEAENDAPLS